MRRLEPSIVAYRIHTLYITLIPQLFSLTLFITSWATTSCSGCCHVRNFTYLSVAIPKTVKSQQDMAKIQIKSEKLTPFGGIFSIMEQFDSTLSSVIDSTLGLRCRLFGYQYSEIIRSPMSFYFCGGSCIEDVTTHLMNHLSLHPTLRTWCSDTILRAIKELTQENISYTSDTGKNYDFNTADALNTLLLNCMFASGQLKEGEV